MPCFFYLSEKDNTFTGLIFFTLVKLKSTNSLKNIKPLGDSLVMCFYFFDALQKDSSEVHVIVNSMKRSEKLWENENPISEMTLRSH